MSETTSADRARRYWNANLRIMAVLMTVWLLVSYGASILFVDQLNAFTLPGTGFPLGFWFAQQGSIYTFVVLIFIYAKKMGDLDRKYGVDDDA